MNNGILKTFLPIVHIFAESGRKVLTDNLRKVKLNVILEQVTKAQRGSRSIALLFL